MMCTDIYIDGEWVHNVGELRAVVGNKFAFDKELCPPAEETPDNCCLCGLDIEATAEMNLMQVRPGKNEWAGTPIISRRGK